MNCLVTSTAENLSFEKITRTIKTFPVADLMEMVDRANDRLKLCLLSDDELRNAAERHQ